MVTGDQAPLTALVTGASRGIGREVAIAAAALGWRVALVARTTSDLEETQEMIRLAGGVADVFPCDLRRAHEIRSVVTAVDACFGPITHLVNAAGAWHDDAEPYYGAHIESVPEQQIDDVIDTGVRATMLLTRHVLPMMIPRGSGKIVNFACGYAGPDEAAGWLHYYVSNRAIEAFTRGLAAEVGAHGVQVNCVAPWFVATEPVKRFFPERASGAIAPGEVAKLVMFLLSSATDHISGEVIEMRSRADFQARVPDERPLDR